MEMNYVSPLQITLAAWYFIIIIGIVSLSFVYVAKSAAKTYEKTYSNLWGQILLGMYTASLFLSWPIYAILAIVQQDIPKMKENRKQYQKDKDKEILNAIEDEVESSGEEE